MGVSSGSTNILQVQKFFGVDTQEFKSFWMSLTEEEKDQVKQEVAEAASD